MVVASNPGSGANKTIHILGEEVVIFVLMWYNEFNEVEIQFITTKLSIHLFFCPNLTLAYEVKVWKTILSET